MVHDGVVYFHHRYCIGLGSTLRELILNEFHGSKIGGHLGYCQLLPDLVSGATIILLDRHDTIYQRLCRELCICQQVKLLSSKLLGLLQPLEIPTAIGEDVRLDFITGLPLVKGQSVIIVVADRLSKYCHLGSLPTHYSVTSGADYIVKQIIRLHGIPKTTVSDRDKVFLSKFWQDLIVKSGTKLKLSTAYYPKSDGQTEIVNKTIEIYLRATIHRNPRSWIELLPWAELWYNAAFHHSAGKSPF